jgi:hypothetical protein
MVYMGIPLCRTAGKVRTKIGIDARDKSHSVARFMIENRADAFFAGHNDILIIICFS